MSQKAPIGFDRDDPPSPPSEGLIDVILNLALTFGVEETIAAVERQKAEVIPRFAKHFGDSYQQDRTAACDLVLERLRAARSALLRPRGWDEVKDLPSD